MNIQSEARTDCFLIVNALISQNNQMMRSELHLIAYMSCLLHIFKSGTFLDWGYPFYGTEDGAPFSDELEAVFSSLLDSGQILPTGESYVATINFCSVATKISTLGTVAPRLECIQASMASVCYFGSGIVREALEQEPVLRRARTAGTRRKLLAEEGLGSLYFHFKFIKERLPEMNDLRASSLLWISSLYETKRLELLV